MNCLGKGLNDAGHDGYALIVKEAELAIHRRLGAPESHLLTVQANLACTYGELGQLDRALQLERDVYHASLRLLGEEDEETLRAAYNYVNALVSLKRFEEAKALMRKTMPVAQRVLGASHELTLRMRGVYAESLCKDPGVTLDDLREAVTTLEETERTARRVFGSEHPLTKGIERTLRDSRAALSAREGDGVSAVRGALEAMNAT